MSKCNALGGSISWAVEQFGFAMMFTLSGLIAHSVKTSPLTSGTTNGQFKFDTRERAAVVDGNTALGRCFLGNIVQETLPRLRTAEVTFAEIKGFLEPQINV